MRATTSDFHMRFPPEMFERVKQRAAKYRRSIHSEILFIVEAALEADAQPAHARQAIVQPPRPIARPPAPAIAARPPGAATRAATSPTSAPAAGMERQAIGVAATINEELRRDGLSPISGPTHVAICRLLATTFPGVRDLAGARAQGVEAWLSAGAMPGLISRLYPDDKGALAMAKSARNAVQIKRRLELGSELQRFIAEKGIAGRGAENMRNVLEHFPGMSPHEAVEQGPEAWLDAGVGEEVARKVFGEDVAKEAKRRGYARNNAKRRGSAMAI
jgi:Arc-like DNA binding domain